MNAEIARINNQPEQIQLPPKIQPSCKPLNNIFIRGTIESPIDNINAGSTAGNAAATNTAGSDVHNAFLKNLKADTFGDLDEE